MLTAEDHLARLLREHGGKYAFEREYRFAPPRRWRADFVIHPRLLVEVEGMLPGAGGRHQRLVGFRNDIEKYAEAVAAGFVVLRVSTKMALDGSAVELIDRTLSSHKIWM